MFLIMIIVIIIIIMSASDVLQKIPMSFTLLALQKEETVVSLTTLTQVASFSECQFVRQFLHPANGT